LSFFLLFLPDGGAVHSVCALYARGSRERSVAVHDALDPRFAFQGVDVLAMDGQAGGSKGRKGKRPLDQPRRFSGQVGASYLSVVAQKLFLLLEQLDEVVRGRRIEALLREEVLCHHRTPTRV